MIKLEELKPVLAEMNLSAEQIEAIQGLDREVIDGSEEIEKLKNELETTNANWEARFKDAFFKGVGVPHDHETEITEQVSEQSGTEETDEGPSTYEELFKEE